MPGDKEPSLYELLQVDAKAETAIIRYAYRYLVARYHPDNEETGDSDMFERLTDAWKVLSDPNQRAAYDRKLADGDRNPRGH